MALIKCKECGKEVSDKAEACPKCGCPIAKKKATEDVQKVRVVKERKSHKKLFIGLAIAAVVISIIGAGCLLILKRVHEAKVYKYQTNLSDITYKMIDGAAKAESMCNLTRSVWYNTIFKESDKQTDKFTKTNGKFNNDFNDSLTTLFLDTDYLSDKIFVESNQEEVKDIMKEMKNPPKEYEDAYDDLSSFYDAYLDFTNLALNPSGNYNSFSDKFSELDSETIKLYDRVKSYLDE